MYDIEKDVENVARAIYQTEWSSSWDDANDTQRTAYIDRAEIALNASTAVTLLKEAEDRIKELEAMNEWLPIDSAPKDGTQVLATNGEDVHVVYYVEIEEDDDRESWYGSSYSYYAFERNSPPTHWKPLTTCPVLK